MKRKYYFFAAAIGLILFLFFVYNNNVQSKKISCSPEGMDSNCEVRKNFSIVQDKLIKEFIAKNIGNVISSKDSCSNYYNYFAKMNDEFYENLRIGNTELTLNESEYICRDGDEGILVYYKYRFGNKGAFCFDGNITNQVYKVPGGYSCEE